MESIVSSSSSYMITQDGVPPPARTTTFKQTAGPRSDGTPYPQGSTEVEADGRPESSSSGSPSSASSSASVCSDTLNEWHQCVPVQWKNDPERPPLGPTTRRVLRRFSEPTYHIAMTGAAGEVDGGAEHCRMIPCFCNRHHHRRNSTAIRFTHDRE
ncbi:uncharacterized protein KNAG_0I02450 [Huiozyma naganishii CBS 8797]|uniref:Uncharacterized protein n=1 Tax=Huiozyma naganishii (strain ATCC MYA-139 / BCRC 22969 / CBS 8797 / KCTC 17520 / NBRC 10181 / NCYC 3082 / Yp74L-3) TaxID=1071383 RepID=J7SAC1_HUIN7|nr:hypothetical protein KNAG_0I02450 [Kazachstania naganishii CBS 8797]CCK72031.1 hypothetical protein KNAG_0I02450 [Kazachstania naganishii CBS 8797]